MLTKRLVACVVALSCTAGVTQGCAARRAEPKTEGVKNRTEQIPVKVSFKIGGALSGEVKDQTVKTQLVVLTTEDAELGSHRLFGMETVDPMKIGSSSVTFGFALQPFQGSGKYTIKAGSIHDLAKAAQELKPDMERSSVKLIWWPDAAVTDNAFDFYRRDEPCRVTVQEDGERGSLHCPKVTNEARDKQFSIDLQWELLEQPSAETSVPTTAQPGVTP